MRRLSGKREKDLIKRLTEKEKEEDALLDQYLIKDDKINRLFPPINNSVNLKSRNDVNNITNINDKQADKL